MIHIPSSGPRSLRPFLVLWIGQAFSLLGSQLVQFALIWWLTQETGRATVLATATIAGFLPQIILGPFVGVLVDRWNRRATMIVADGLVAAATMLLAFLFWTGQIEIWHVYAMLFVRALGGTFHWPAMQASTTLLVPADQLTRVQGLNQMLNGGMAIASAPLGALLLATLSMQAILAIDVVTALVAIVTLLLVAIPQPQKPEGAAAASVARSLANDFAEGFRYVRGWTGLMILLGLAMLMNMVLSPAGSLTPLLVKNHFEGTAWHLGAMEAAIGIGVIVGGAALGVLVGSRPAMTMVRRGVIGLGLSVVLLGLVPASLFPLAVGAMFMMGATSSLTNGPLMATFQRVIEPDMQGRVFSLIGSLAAAMSPVGLAVAGPIADLIGVRWWLIIAGSVTVAVGIASYFMPALHDFEAGRGSTEAPLAAAEGDSAQS